MSRSGSTAVQRATAEREVVIAAAQWTLVPIAILVAFTFPVRHRSIESVRESRRRNPTK